MFLRAVLNLKIGILGIKIERNPTGLDYLSGLGGLPGPNWA